MRLYDCHLHVTNGLDQYDLELSEANVIFNSVKEYQEFKDDFQSFDKSLIFDYKSNFELIRQEVEAGNIIALKIHSRIQEISMSDYKELSENLRKLQKPISIIYDAFYFGNEMEFQPNLNFLIQLAKDFPNNNFIVAHSGGYEILKYFFHLREFSNVGYDLSFSLQYLEDTSCFADLIKLCKYTPKSRLFFGSDFPFAIPSLQKNVLDNIAKTLKWSEDEIDGIFYSNYKNFVINT